MIFFKVTMVLGLVGGVLSQGSYYSSFSGPVSGAVDEIVVPESAGFQSNANGESSFDYVAKPDYAFGYGVNDPVTGNAQKHEESRDGDTVRGQYSVLEPDGSIRTVTYTADPENGFQATVHRKPPSDTPIQFAFDNPIQDFGSAPVASPVSDDVTPEYTPEYSSAEYTPEYQAEYSPEY